MTSMFHRLLWLASRTLELAALGPGDLGMYRHATDL